MTPWIRPAWVRGARRARLETWALLDGARIDDALERARAEVDDDAAWDALEVTVRARATDGGRLDAALAGRPLMTLESRSEHERVEVARCQRYVELAASPADSPSLIVLQAQLAVVGALAAEGDLTLALDAPTARWWSPDELAALGPASRPFALDEHVQVVIESVERRPGVGHLVRSRGLDKFARADVGGRAPRRDAERIAELVRDVARMLAEGAELRPGDRLRVPDLPPLTIAPRADDALSDAPADSAPLYELRDLDDGGRPAPTCERLIAALRPRAKLKVVR